MKKYSIYLKAVSEEGEERFSVQGERLDREGGDLFRFTAGDAEYSIFLGEVPSVSRGGDLSYKIFLDSSKETFSVIQTAFGSFSVGVKVERLSMRFRESAYFFKAEYILSFSDFDRKHSILFTAKEI